MVHLDCDGDEPPAGTVGNRGAHDLAREAQFLSHVDMAKLRHSKRVSIDRKLIVGQIEAQSVPFLAFKVRETSFLPILTWMFELRKRPLLFHPPVIVKGAPKM